MKIKYVAKYSVLSIISILNLILCTWIVSFYNNATGITNVLKIFLLSVCALAFVLLVLNIAFLIMRLYDITDPDTYIISSFANSAGVILEAVIPAITIFLIYVV